MATRSPRSRLWFLRIHMIAGLILAAYAVLIGLTGSVLVFRDLIKAWEYPNFHKAAHIEISTTPDQALAAVKTAWRKDRPISITWPNEESPYWMSYVLLKEGGAREVFVNPATAAIVGSRDPSGGVNGWFLRLHTNLMAGSAGRRLNGYAAWTLVLMCLTGAVLWWPRTGSWKRNFQVSFGAGWRALSWQLHHASGAISFVFILILAITGTYFFWPSEYVAAVGRVFPRTVEPRPPQAEGGLLSITELASRAQAALPGREIQRIAVVDSPGQAVRVTLREGTPAEFHRVSTVFLHPVTGEVLLVNPLASRPTGDAILSWFSALHFGVFGGWPVRILWAILGFSLPVLGITGCLMWWRRIVEPALRRQSQKERAPRVPA